MTDKMSPAAAKPRPPTPPPQNLVVGHPSDSSAASRAALNSLGILREERDRSPGHLPEDMAGDWVELAPGKDGSLKASDDIGSDKDGEDSSETKGNGAVPGSETTPSSGGVIAYINSWMPWSSPSRADLALARELQLQKAREEAKKLKAEEGAALERERELQRAREEAESLEVKRLTTREIEEAIATLNTSLEPILKSLEEHLVYEQSKREELEALSQRRVSSFLEGADSDTWREYQAFTVRYAAAKPDGHNWATSVSQSERKRLNKARKDWKTTTDKLTAKSNNAKKEASQPIREKLKELRDAISRLEEQKAAYQRDIEEKQAELVALTA